MKTYMTKSGRAPGDKYCAYIMIRNVISPSGVIQSFYALGTTIDRIEPAVKYGPLTTVFAYAKQDNPKVNDIVWYKQPADELSNLMADYLEKQGYGALRYSFGQQVSASFLSSMYEYELKLGYRKPFVAYMLDGKLHVVHESEAADMKHDRPLFKADWVFGLSEFILRFDRGNLQDNSVLVITYRGEKYQTREYVITNAIRKGFDSEALAVLVDLLSTGKVVFAGMDDLYTGPCSLEPRELTISELAAFELSGGRSPDVGITIGEDVRARVLMYLDHISPENLESLRKRNHSTRYRYDENVGPIAKLS